MYANIHLSVGSSYRNGLPRGERQRDEVHNFLVKYIDKLTDGKAKTRVFVPLCGKSLDMLWLAD